MKQTDYFALVSGRFEMHLSICEDRHRSFRAVYQSWVKELGHVTLAGLVKVPPFSVLVVDCDIFRAGSA